MLLREAKAKEWNAWIENDVVEVCKKAGIPKERIIGSRCTVASRLSVSTSLSARPRPSLGFDRPGGTGTLGAQ